MCKRDNRVGEYCDTLLPIEAMRDQNSISLLYYIDIYDTIFARCVKRADGGEGGISHYLQLYQPIIPNNATI